MTQILMSHLFSTILVFIGILTCRDHSNFVNCVRFSPDGNKFITVSSDKRGLLYDGKTAEVKGELSKEDAHTGSIYAVSWSPDSKQVVNLLFFSKFHKKCSFIYALSSNLGFFLFPL